METTEQIHSRESRSVAAGDAEVAAGIEQPLSDHLPLADCEGSVRGLVYVEPEYPDAEAFVAASHYRPWRESEPRQVTRIVIHVTAGQGDYRRTVKYMQNPTRNGEPLPVSAHYVIGQQGEVVQMVRHNDVAFHARSANKNSIGIEHVARPPREWSREDPGLMPTEAEYQSSARLVRFLCGQYGLLCDREHIVGHNEADPTTSHTNCPTGAWDWDYFMRILNGDD